MSKTILTKNSIRLLALPLSRKDPSLIYFYAQRIKRDEGPNQIRNSISKTSTIEGVASRNTNENYRDGEVTPVRRRTISSAALMSRIIEISSRQWLKLSEAPVGSVKSKLHIIGERMMDRISYEEWALKTIDLVKCKGPNDPRQQNSNTNIVLLYPKFLAPEKDLLKLLSNSIREKEPYHKRWMRLNIFLSPLTLPFALIPLVPNLPLFYMMWRAWSHWRAFKASQFLNQMIKTDDVKLQHTPILDQIYSSQKKLPIANNNNIKESSSSDVQLLSDRTRSEDGEKKKDVSEKHEDDVILTKEMVEQIKQRFELPEESRSEIIRAINQARNRNP
ncbi:mitochondrial K+-H+ exchange-related-domain-containing protein [Phakopsora pachyrhizi]|uniref:Mitochondrial K+-H+ exchange-related-domain-containing protein n=1 Tax=Phakopsora pachyrhizi TaxID=170000 RepID=A0AAV0AHX0_PHAPC|nr:mitochondrial K+-H+ exchange-related-domain-containing protein [Phakopsora pachyrhizi]